MTAAVELEFDPYSHVLHADPYPTYALLREHAPAYRNDTLGFWALTRHADVREAFHDADRYSSADGVTLDPAATGPHASKVMSFLAMDNPRHARMRSLVSKGFTPRRIAELDARVREITHDHLDAAIASGTFDFIEDLAAKVPMDVISELLGVPAADRAALRRHADRVVYREDGVLDVPPAAVEASVHLITYYVELIADRRKQRRDDLTSALIDAEIDGEHLTDDELVAFLFLMVVAGNETTTKLLGNTWYWAHRNPSQKALVLADPVGAIPRWVEETLRYDNSTQVLARTCVRDTGLHGQTIAAGDRVLLVVGSANRDERAFADPDVYDLARDTSETLSFGTGRHYCLGASLARLEARIVLEELLALVRDYDVDVDACERVHSVNVRGFRRMPVTVEHR